MPAKRVLLMYIHEHSGHHRAAIALEKGIRRLDPRADCLLVDVLRYTHPILERLIGHTYLEIIKKRPEVWEHLYDNPRVLKSVKKLSQVIHTSHSRKFKKLINDFAPQAIACTQAFPCGISADYKMSYEYRVPLYAVLTDYLPHSYWALEGVDQYFVPSDEAKEMLHQNGVFEDRIRVTGIPIDVPTVPNERLETPGKALLILIMGGSQGLGPIEEIVKALDQVDDEFEMAVVAGKNKPLFRRLQRMSSSLKKRVKVYAYVENVMELMSEASLLVSKPGGLSIAQALALRLPVVFIDPIPGQEAKNASYLLRHHSAIEARSGEEAAVLVEQLLKTPAKMKLMKQNMAALAHPDAADQIAEAILGENCRVIESRIEK